MDPTKTVIIPPTTSHTHTVIFLHGRGDTAERFSSSLERSRTSQNQTLEEAFPSFRWVFPQAALRKCARYPEGPATPQWFDVWDHRDRSAREDLQIDGLRESVDEIRDLVEHEATTLRGIHGGMKPGWDCVLLAGISQGGATAVHTLLNLHFRTVESPTWAGGDARLAAVMGFSTYLALSQPEVVEPTLEAGRDDIASNRRSKLLQLRKKLDLDGWNGDSEVVHNTPILLEHCMDDATVFVQQGGRLRDELEGLGARVTWKAYPTGRHWFNSLEGMDDVVGFLDSVLELPARKVTAKASKAVNEEDDGDTGRSLRQSAIARLLSWRK